MVLMDLFSGGNRISGDITCIPVLLEKIKKYPGCNRLVFGVSSDKPPTLVMIKKMMLVLIPSILLSHMATVATSTEGGGTGASVMIKAVLGYSLHNNNNDMPIYAIFHDSYWYKVKVLRPIIF